MHIIDRDLWRGFVFEAGDPTGGALNDPEGAGADPPAANDPAETDPNEAAPDAGGELGDSEPAGTGEADPNDPRTHPLYERVQELSGKNRRLEDELAALRAAQDGGVGVAAPQAQRPATEPETPGLALPEGLDLDMESEGVVFLVDTVKSLVGQIGELKQQVTGVAQKTQAQEAAELQTRFDATADALAKAAGRTLTAEQKDALAEQTAIIGHGYRAVGKTASLEDAMRSAFVLMGVNSPSETPDQKAAKERAAKLAEEKRRLAAGRPGNVSGPSEPSNPEGMSMDEALDAAMRKRGQG